MISNRNIGVLIAQWVNIMKEFSVMQQSIHK